MDTTLSREEEAVVDLVAAANTASMPICVVCHARPVIATCQVCKVALCLKHIANREAHLDKNEWAACQKHEQEVRRLNAERWHAQYAAIGGEA